VAGYDHVYGARPLKRVVQNAVLNPLARMILEGKVPPRSKLVVNVDNDTNTLKLEAVPRD